MEKKEIKEQLEYAKESMGFTPEIMQLIGGEAPEWFKLYRASDKAMWTDTALPAKIKVQMKSALNHGATKEEILDTLGVVFVTAGAPGVNVCKSAMKKLLLK